MSKTNLNDFLVLISSDHETWDFPIHHIQKELTIMYLDRDDFNEGLMKAHYKLRKKYGEVLANIFLTIADFKLKIKEGALHRLSEQEYYDLLDTFFTSLSKTRITRVGKTTPDGKMLTQMASE